MSIWAHLDLDGAWGDVPHMPTRDARAWGPRLRYLTRRSVIDRFYEEVARALPPFVVYGSGDFHHLAAVLIRRFEQPLTVVSFDNHPDWDVRPPKWSCGAWVNRALELKQVQQISVWGCGNFELAFPSRIFRNRWALKSGRLEVHAWAERQSASTQRCFSCMARPTWRERFAAFAERLKGQNVYVTVDMDCLRAEEAVTNWENGLFTAEDVAWAICKLGETSPVVGGDICGAYSSPDYATWFQRRAGNWDHPKLAAINAKLARERNLTALNVIIPAMTC
jgi:arginase family enzyme